MRQRLEISHHWLIIPAITLVIIIGWNFWLPMAEDFYNLVTPADENRQVVLRNVDFFAYYNGGARFEDGANPYYYGEPELRHFSDFIYPPTMLPIFSLISRMEYDPARLFWLGLNSMSYVLCFMLMLLAAKQEIRQAFLAGGLILTTASFPLLMHIHNGQADVLVISLVLIGYTIYIKGFKTASAGLFALAALIKVSPVLFLIFFVIFLRDYRFLVSFCLWASGIVLISLLMVPIDLYRDYIFQVLPEVSKGTSNWLNQSIVKYVPASQSWLAQVISLGGLGAFSLFAWRLSRRYPADQRKPGRMLGETDSISESVFFLNILIILILAGRVWSMAYVWTILPSALLVARLLDRRTRPWYFALSCLAVFLLDSKVYGYPILDSTNLWGSLLMFSILVINLIKKNGVVQASSGTSND